MPSYYKLFLDYIRLCKSNGSEPQLHVVMQELVCSLDPIYEMPLRYVYSLIVHRFLSYNAVSRQDYVQQRILEMMKTPPKTTNSVSL